MGVRIHIDANLTMDVPQGVVFVSFHFPEALANARTGQAVDLCLGYRG